MKWWCALSVLLLIAAPAFGADGEIGLYLDDPVEGLVYEGNTEVGVAFDVVALARMNVASSGAEFVMTEMAAEIPGVFKFNTVKMDATNVDLGDNEVGEYMFWFSECVEAGDLQLVRLSYIDTVGAISWRVLEIRGFQSGDSLPSSNNGLLSYRDCDGVPQYLQPAWNPLGAACIPPGSLVLNGFPAASRCSPVTDSSFSALKARY